MLVWPSTNGASRSDQYIYVYQLKTFYSKTLLATASNTGMVQCKEKVVKESTGKEESHVDVCTRVGNHSRGDGACGPCGLSERHLGDAAARCTGRTVSGRAVCGALSSRRATGLRALATSGGHRVAIRGESHGPTSRRCGA